MRLGMRLGVLYWQLIWVANAIPSTPLTILSPCPAAPPALGIKPVTVTTQLQAVSTCSASSLCVRGRCSTSFLFETYAYISTVIPCAWNGATIQSTTVTRTDQHIIVSEEWTTLFKTSSTATAGHWKYFYLPWHWHGKEQEYEKEVFTRRAVAPFKDIRPFAIPGWSGSDLFGKNETDRLHHFEQNVQVFECRLSKRRRKCMAWQETWVVRSDLKFSSSISIPVRTSVRVPSRGMYVWSFPQVIPPKTFTARKSTITIVVSNAYKSTSVIPAQTYTVPPHSWTAHITRTFSGPTVLDITIYVTTTITYTSFCYTKLSTT